MSRKHNDPTTPPISAAFDPLGPNSVCKICKQSKSLHQLPQLACCIQYCQNRPVIKEDTLSNWHNVQRGR